MRGGRYRNGGIAWWRLATASCWSTPEPAPWWPRALLAPDR